MDAPMAALAALAALAIWTGTASPAPQSITLAEAERLLAGRGFDVLVAEAAAAGAEGDLTAQSASPNPTLSGGALVARAVPQAQFAATAGYNLGVSDNAALADLVSGKKALRREVAAAALRAARAGKDDALRNLRFQLRAAFIGALLARDNLSFAEDVLATWQDTLKLNQTRYQLGAAGIADVARVETAKGEAEQAVAQARAAAEQASAGLLVFLGRRDPVVPLAPRGDLAYRADAAPALRAADLDELLAAAGARRPDLLAAAANRQQAERALALARRLRVPDVTLQAAYSSQVDLASTPPTVVSPPDYTFGVALPLPVFDRQRGQILRAQANLDAARALENKAHAQAAADLLGAIAGLAAARDQVERMDGTLLASARTARDAEKILYEKGAASLLDFLDAERTWVAANVERHQDLASYWTAVAQLRQALGDGAPLSLGD